MAQTTGKGGSILPFVPESRRQLIWILCKRQWGWIATAMGVALLQTAIVPLSAGALKSFVDDVAAGHHQHLKSLIIEIAVLALLNAVVMFTLNQLISRVIFHLEFELRAWLHERLQALDPRTLDSVATGQMITRAMTDIVFMETFILLIPYLIGYGLVLLALGIYLGTQSILLTVVVALAIPLNLLPIFRMRKPLWGFSWVQLQRRAEVTTVIDETVRGVRVVKAFDRGPEERRKLAGVAEGAFGVSLSRARFFARFEFVLKLIPAAMGAAILYLAAPSIVGKAMTVGTFVVFLRYSSVFNDFANSMSDFVNTWQAAKAATGRIVDLISFVHGAHVSPRTGTTPVPAPSSGLQMTGVGFSYDENTVLRDLDLTLEPGRMVVVTGGPRSGKSTVAALAVGALEPDRGTVLLDGADVSLLDPAAVRREVRVLTEEPFLFGRTVRENLEIGAGRTGVDDETLHAALRAAGAEEIVAELSGGLDEELGDRGLTLSGGQRQRLALARAIVIPPRVLVLDDALLAVNPSLEMEILRRLRAHAPHMAILCLSRREGPAAVADGVVPLPDARHDSAAAPVTDDADRDVPFDDELLRVMSKLPEDTDTPSVKDADCETSDEEPSLRSMLRPIRWGVGGVTTLLLFATAFLLVPIIVLYPATNAIQRLNFKDAQAWAIIGFLAAVIAGGINWYQRIKRTDAQESVMYLLRRRTLHRLTRLGIDYYDRELPGQVASRVVYDLDRISDLLGDQSDGAVYQFVSSILILALTLAAMFVFSTPVALVGLLFVPVLLVESLGFLPVADRAYDRQRTHLGRTITRLQEDFAGRHVIHSYVGEERSQEEFWAIARLLRRAQRWAQVVQNGYDALIQFTIDLAGAAVLWRAGGLVGKGIALGTLIVMRQFIDYALLPIPRATRSFRFYLIAKASLHTLRQPFRAPINPPEDAAATACPPLAGEIAFDDVTFTYPGTLRQVLHDVSFDIAPGQIVAMVGPTGAGKSSIAKLVGRTYDPNQGSVRIDGVALPTYEVGSYRKRLGIVPQDAFCFRGTVASNISYGKTDATREQVENAARAVGAYETLLSVPGGYDGTVEEEGRNLTAAQRQMMALARAWLAGPDILILDEATSTLDLALEQKVLDAIGPLGCTTIFITHRLAVAKRADKVVVIDAGRVVDQGTHDELIGRGGAYTKLWHLGPDVEGTKTIDERV